MLSLNRGSPCRPEKYSSDSHLLNNAPLHELQFVTNRSRRKHTQAPVRTRHESCCRVRYELEYLVDWDLLYSNVHWQLWCISTSHVHDCLHPSTCAAYSSMSRQAYAILDNP